MNFNVILQFVEYHSSLGLAIKNCYLQRFDETLQCVWNIARCCPCPHLGEEEEDIVVSVSPGPSFFALQW